MRHALPLRSALALTALIPVTALAQTECEPQRLRPIPGGTIGDFGSAIAMNDRHLIIGDRHDSRYCTVDPTCSNGMVYAYQKDAQGRWVLVQEVEPADLGPRFAFGAAVALDGDRMIATAEGDGAGVGGLGAAYFFEFDGARWREVQAVQNPRTASFGAAAVLRGDSALVQNGAKAALYRYWGDAWEFVRLIESPDAPSTSAGFGYIMDIDAERVVIGAPLERSMVANGGAAYIFRREPDGALAFEQKLIAPDVLEGPRFGTSVAVEGDTIFVGAELADRTHPDQGVVYVYERRAGGWELVQELRHDDAAEVDRFGSAVAVDGDLLVVGASTKYTPVTTTGAAYLFHRDDGGQWRQVSNLAPIDRSPAQYTIDFGGRVAMAGGMAVVGASDTWLDGVPRGSVDVFDLACTDCPPDLDADGSLTVFDFLLFLNLFQDANPLADFDGDGQFTIFDFLAFQTAFDAGCA